MNTAQEILESVDLEDRQLAREFEQHEEGKTRLAKRTEKAQDKSYASSTVYGQKLLKHYTGPIGDHVKGKLKNIGRGRGAVDASTVYKHLKGADPELLVVLALKVSLDTLGHTQTPNVVNLTEKIGSAVEVEMKLRWWKANNPEVFHSTSKHFHKSSGARHKHDALRHAMRKARLEWKNWGPTTHHKVGSWLLQGIMEVTGWISKELIQKSTRKRQTAMRFSKEFMSLRDQIMSRAMELAFCLWPMVAPPKDWTDDPDGLRGGYYTEELRGTAPMIRKVVGFGPRSKQGSVPVAFLNRLQQQAYRLNPAVMEMAEFAYRKRMKIGKFSHEEPLPLGDDYQGDPDDDPERFKEWKRNRARIYDHNAQLNQKNWRVTETMFVARKYVEEVFYIPWSFDYRGRVYPQNTQLNPQGTDFDKALLLFAEEGPVNDYWLAWHVCTTYGNDKLSHDDRVQWTKDNHALITQIAEDPIGTIPLWEGAGEPWCFLAAAIEYHACVIQGSKSTSGLPIGIDATCSGLQHLSSMTRDANAAKQVNVIRGAEDKPSDGYKTVAEAALKYIEDETIHPFMNRKITKRTVMTVPYGVSRDSARGYIREALADAGVDLSVPGRLGMVTDAVYHRAVPEVFAGPVDVMNWLQQTSQDLLDAGQVDIRWTTPSGFEVIQDIRKPVTKRIDTMLLGSVVACEVGTGHMGDPDRKRHKGAIAPNLVHSLDASLLHLMFYQWRKPFTVIHDCVLGRSCDMDEMMKDIRLHHAEIYKGKPLEDWAEQQGVTIPDGLIKDTLDLDLVNDSPYFFC